MIVEHLLDDPRAFLLLFVGVFSFVMALRIYTKVKKGRTARYFVFISLFVGIWVVGRALFSVAETFELARFLSYFFFVSPIFIVLFLLLFSLSLENENKPLSSFARLIIFCPWSFLLGATLFYRFPITPLHSSGTGGFEISYNSFFSYFYAPVITLYLLALFPILLGAYRRTTVLERPRLRYILGSVFFSVGVALIANILLPLFGLISFVWVGPTSAIVPVAAIGYALLRRDVWNLKLIVAEFFVFGIILLLLFDIFLNTTQVAAFIFKFITLALTVIFGYFLIRGIFNEYESRERIKHLADELSIANKRLQEIDQEKSDFVSIAAHQLRTPLTVIKGYGSMLLEGTFGPIEEPSHRGIIQKIYDASERLVKMIDDFLDISRIEAGEMSYAFEKLDIEKLVEEVMGEFRATTEGAQIPILIRGTGSPLYIVGDELKIRQVLANLLDNAIKYSYKNNRITITLKKEAEKALLSFEDEGVGIPLEKRSNLFRKYSRVVSADKLQREGRGLGLYIARQIMLAHSGTIWVESEGIGRGSTFYITFPLFHEGIMGGRVEVRPLVGDSKPVTQAT